MLARLICWVVVSVLVCGCRANISSQSQECPPCTTPETAAHEEALTTDSALKARLSAALAIDVLSMREDAVVAIALDAAQAGNAEAVRAALSHIEVVKTRDDLTSECAVRLARAGNFEEAIAMAKTLNSVDVKYKTLKKIATGD